VVDCADNKQGNNMKNIAQGERRRLDLPVGQ
jgi:hypothetical protein